MKLHTNHATFVAVACIAALALAACDQPQANQPKYQPLEYSDFFGDARSSRDLVANTVARGHLRDNEALFTGKLRGQELTTFPLEVTAQLVSTGHERFSIFCAQCHGRTGDGSGMLVQRGYARPPSFHEDRLVTATVGHIFDVASNGFGRMPDYSGPTSAHERWAIIAYIRALQLSRRVSPEELSPADRAKLAAAPPATTATLAAGTGVME